jgi:DNA adenine methylase
MVRGTAGDPAQAGMRRARRPPEGGSRPFLKWAGGKGQLLQRLEAHFPEALRDGSVQSYAEPFLGGGAMFFHVMRSFPSLKSAYLADAKEELVLAYSAVQRDAEALISGLESMAAAYLHLDEEGREERFLKVRESFNREKAKVDFLKYSTSSWVKRAAQIIFLNRTCYNGLFRVNSRGGFNVPFGRYVNPRIVDPENLRACSEALGRSSVRIHLGDFGDLAAKAALLKQKTFIYYDPPYLPISRTASFTAYSRVAFGEAEQKRLAGMFRALDRPGVYQMLSNSDPKNEDPRNDFFEELYAPYRDTIYRVPATRLINSKPELRGRINEIIITNYVP